MRNKILEKADNVINGARREDYGDAGESFGLIAKLWSTYKGITITTEDVAMMMIMLKIVRAKGKYNTDNYVDICGYGALASDLAREIFYASDANEDEKKNCNTEGEQS